MKPDDTRIRDHVLHPDTTQQIPLDDFDRTVAQEALLWYAEERIDDDETEQYVEQLANHIFDYDRN